MSDDPCGKPLTANAEAGMVVVEGVGVAATLTADAALATADRLTYAATQAIGQLAMDRVARPTYHRT